MCGTFPHDVFLGKEQYQSHTVGRQVVQSQLNASDLSFWDTKDRATMGALPIGSGIQLLGSRRAEVADSVKLRRPTMTVRVNTEVVYSSINRA